MVKRRSGGGMWSGDLRNEVAADGQVPMGDAYRAGDEDTPDPIGATGATRAAGVTGAAGATGAAGTWRDTLLDRPVGPMPYAPNLGPDVAKVQRLLSGAGRYDPAGHDEQGGTYSDGLEAAIRTYQRDRGLAADGTLMPNGPTVAALKRDLFGRARSGKGEDARAGARDLRTAAASDDDDGDTPRLMRVSDPGDYKRGTHKRSARSNTNILLDRGDDDARDDGYGANHPQPNGIVRKHQNLLLDDSSQDKRDKVSRNLAENIDPPDNRVKTEGLPPLPDPPETQPSNKALDLARVNSASAVRRMQEITKQRTDAQIDGALSNLSFEDRFNILHGLSRKTDFNAADQKYVEPLYKSIFIPPEGLRVDFSPTRMQALARRLADEADILGWRFNWSNYSRGQKREYMENAINIVRNEFGLPPAKLIIVPSYDAFGTEMKNIFHVRPEKSERNNVYIHENSSAWTVFGEAVIGVVHEPVHHYQMELAERFRRGQIKPTDPRYRQAALFAINLFAQKDRNGEDNHIMYIRYNKNQPVERHAYALQDVLLSDLLNEENRRKR